MWNEDEGIEWSWLQVIILMSDPSTSIRKLTKPEIPRPQSALQNTIQGTVCYHCYWRFKQKWMQIKYVPSSLLNTGGTRDD